MNSNTETFPVNPPAKRTKKYAVRFSFMENGFVIVYRNNYLRDQKGRVRTFKTQNGARKAITRQRTGNFHN